MIKGLEAILLSSPKAKNLATFYEEVVGLKLNSSYEMGEKGEEVYDFELGNGVHLYIMDHSKVTGQNSLPDRNMFNLEVGDIEVEAGRLKKKGARLVQDIYHVQDYGHIATFRDADGNYFQLVKTRP